MTEHDHDHDLVLSRRGALAKLGGFAVVALSGAALGTRELLDAEDADAAGDGPAAVSSGLVSCVLAPEQTEGPYYVEDAALRRNVTEGRPGVALALRLTVVNVASCRPIKGAAVEIWHCDASGVYSGVQGDTGMFLRGVQRADAKGVAVFKTIYPGWYQGRTVHIHTKVHLGERRAYRAAVLPRLRHQRGVHAEPVQPAAQSNDAQRGRQHLPQRRQALDAEARSQRIGVRRLDRDGSPAVVNGSTTACFTPRNREPLADVLSYEPLGRERRDVA
jgi:Dioxygenase